MRKVAIFSDGWKKFFNFSWVDGCHQYIMDHGLDAQVYVFNSFGSFSVDEKFNTGEYNIFNLPNLKEFDGIIVDVNNVEDDMVKEEILRKVRNSGVPAVSLLNEIMGMHYAGIDNFDAMYRVAEYVIAVHGCKKINFVGGPCNNYENRERLRAYMQALEDHNIAYEASRVFSGSFAITTGEDAFFYFEEKGKMPEAFICANDNIAAGLCHVAKEKGYRIPEDFIVTGFDNLDKASYFEPKITTVGFERGEISYKAMELLHRLWEGEKSPGPGYVQTQHIFQDSCGCKSDTVVNHGKYVEDHIWNEDRDMRMDRAMMELKRELLECRSFHEMGKRLPAHLKPLKCDEIYMCINKEIAFCEKYAGTVESGEMPIKIIGYPDEMEFVMAYVDEENVSGLKRHAGKLLPEGFESDQKDIYVVSPLHFREREVGYLVFKNCDYMLDCQLIFEILNVLLESMENMYHRLMLSHLNAELSQLYVMDALTGLYNRMAYNRLAMPMYLECMRENRKLLVMFVDVDRLKYINDNFGHDNGNVAIKTIAAATAAEVPEQAIIIRYGGDEFIVLAPDVEDAMAKELLERIQSRLAELVRKEQTNFPITASIGYVIADGGEKSLGEYIDEADAKMYEVKREHHQNQ